MLWSKIKRAHLAIDNYIVDGLYAFSRFRWGLFSPKVVKGYFEPTENGRAQEEFYNILLNSDAHKSRFQLIFPNQTAGLRLKKTNEDLEYHIRFYPDKIDAEIEYGPFHRHHLKGNIHDYIVLEELLESNTKDLSQDTKATLTSQFENVDYSKFCSRQDLHNGVRTNAFTYNKKLDDLLNYTNLTLKAVALINATQMLFTGKSFFEYVGFEQTPLVISLLNQFALYWFADSFTHLANLCKYGTTDTSKIGHIRADLIYLRLYAIKYSHSKLETL